MQTKSKAPTVIIVGSGFAGIAAVQSLQRSGAPCEIVLVTKTDLFEYYPALYKLVTGALAIEASVPLASIKSLKKVTLEHGVFVAADPARQVITLEDGKELAYDYLVLALGSETNYFNIPGLPDLSFSFKSVKEAFRLKRHFCNIMSASMDLKSKEAVAKLHTVIVGAGPSGVELAGDLKEYLRELAESMGVDPSLVTVDLIEAAPRVLPMMSEKVSNLADLQLRKLGVNIYTNRGVTNQDISGVSMGNMDFQTSTVIWTAGTRINSAYRNLPGATFSQRGKVEVSDSLSLPSDNHVFVIGDGAETPYSGLAQTAIYDGKFIGRHIARLIWNLKPSKYKAKRVSYVVPIGKWWAVFVHGKVVLRGALPWLLRSAIDFKFLWSILPLLHVLEIFRQGAKYRRSKTYCPME